MQAGPAQRESARGLTGDVAQFIANAGAQPLPAAAEQATARALTNWIGCALGARDDAAVAAVRAALPVIERADAADTAASASLIGHAGRLDPARAALLNGCAGNALDFDDMHGPTLIHPCATVAPAALAVAEAAHASGAQLLSALAVGIEVTLRLGEALFPAHYDAGWHASATLGTVGCAAAACALLGLPPERTAHALGIAATQAGGLRAMLANPCKSFNLGRAAEAGVNAARYAQAGLDSDPCVLESRHGLFDVFGWPQQPADLLGGAGSHWRVESVSLKPYPCGVVIHPVIDACLELLDADPVASDRMQRIALHVHPRVLDLAGERHPVSALRGRFSVCHAAALALVRGSAGLDAFDDAAVDDPQLHGLRERMQVIGEPGLGVGQARVAVTFVDGRVRERSVSAASGSPQRPLSETALRAKFINLAVRALDAPRAGMLFAQLRAMADCPDVAALAGSWCASPPGNG
jgi:2-methylcitrate dehydratase PrpD